MAVRVGASQQTARGIPRRGTMTRGTAVLARVEARQSVFLCSGCAAKTPLQRHHYSPLTRFHGYGYCDACQAEQACTLYFHASNPYVAELPRQEAAIQAVRRRDRQQGQR